MPCPFCDSLLDKYEYESHTAYECENHRCINDDMPCYKMRFFENRNVVETIMFKKESLYVRIDYDNNMTDIFRLMACMLVDQIRIPKVLEFNKYEHDCLPKLLNKVKTLVTFS